MDYEAMFDTLLRRWLHCESLGQKYMARLYYKAAEALIKEGRVYL